MSLTTLLALLYSYLYFIQYAYATKDICSSDHRFFNDYVLLASDVQKWSQASSVFIIFGGNDESLPATTMMLNLIKDLSSRNVLSSSANYTEILIRYRKIYSKKIVRPLIVVLLSSESDLISFRDTTQAYDMSIPQWLIIFMDPTIEFCKKPKENIFNLKFDTSMIVKCFGDPKLREWYTVYDNQITTYDLATWDPQMRFRMLTNETLYERRDKIGGKYFRVSTVMESPFVSSRFHEDGLFRQIIEELSRPMNFTYDIVHKETSYGVQNSITKSWTGTMGKIVNGEADIGVAEMTMTVPRMQSVDFTVPLILSRNRLYLQPPSGSSVHWSSYSSAFDFEIWVVLSMVLSLAVILITVIRLHIEKRPIPPGHISENTLNVWGTFCQQGLADFPTSTPLRIAYFSLFMSSVVLLAIYSACLISYLTLSVPSLPFNDLESFAKIGSYKLLTYLGSADYNMFMSATDPTMMKMRNLLQVDLPKTVMSGFQMTCSQRKVVFYATEAVKEQLNTWLPCDLVSIDTGRFDSLGMVLTKGSAYTGVINHYLQKFKDCGIMSRLKRKYFMNVASPSNEYQPVSLRGIVPLIVVLLVGVAMALLVFFIEKIVFQLNKSMNARKQIAHSDRRIAALKTLLVYEKYVRNQSSR